jgi:hypothetical protein
MSIQVVNPQTNATWTETNVTQARVDSLRSQGMVVTIISPVTASPAPPPSTTGSTGVATGGVSTGDSGLAMPYAACWKKLLDLIAAEINAQVKPIAKINIVNQAATGGQNIITGTSTTIAPLQPTNAPCIFRVYVVLGTSGVFSVQRRVGGGGFLTENLNAGIALTAAAAYMFDVLVDSNEFIDFQTSVSGQVLKLCVVEKDDAK